MTPVHYVPGTRLGRVPFIHEVGSSSQWPFKADTVVILSLQLGKLMLREVHLGITDRLARLGAQALRVHSLPSLPLHSSEPGRLFSDGKIGEWRKATKRIYHFPK